MPVPTMVNDPLWHGSRAIAENLMLFVVWVEVWVQGVRHRVGTLGVFVFVDSTNNFQFTADNIRLDIIRKVKTRKYLAWICLELFSFSRIFSHLNQEIFYFVVSFCHCKVLHIVI